MSTERGQKLTPRDLAVLRCAALGDDVKETARALALSTDTVKDYRGRAVRKLKAKSITHAVVLAVLSKVIEVPA